MCKILYKIITNDKINEARELIKCFEITESNAKGNTNQPAFRTRHNSKDCAYFAVSNMLVALVRAPSNVVRLTIFFSLKRLW